MCCGEGGTLQTNITGVCGECSQCMDHAGFVPTHNVCASQSTLLRLQVALQGYCPNWALHFVYFPVLNCLGSDSWVLCKGTDLVGHTFFALPRSEQLRRPGAWRAHCPRWAVHLNYLPDPSRSVSREDCKSAISDMPCVSSSWELISGCDPPGRCQPSRIPGRLG